MARPVFVLALILIALVGLVSAAGGSSHGVAAPAGDNDIGNVGEDAAAPSLNDVVEGPLGSAEEAAKNMGGGAAQGPSSGATATTTSTAVVGAAAAAVAGYFVF